MCRISDFILIYTFFCVLPLNLWRMYTPGLHLNLFKKEGCFSLYCIYMYYYICSFTGIYGAVLWNFHQIKPTDSLTLSVKTTQVHLHPRMSHTTRLHLHPRMSHTTQVHLHRRMSQTELWPSISGRLISVLGLSLPQVRLDLFSLILRCFWPIFHHNIFLEYCFCVNIHFFHSQQMSQFHEMLAQYWLS